MMSWFRKNKEPVVPEALSQHKAAVEIVAHKNATDEAKAEVDQANRQLRELFDRNHFTIKIFLAAGGEKPKLRSNP